MIKIADAYIINGYYDEALRYLQDNLAQQEALRGSSNAPDDLEQKILLSKLSYCRYYYRRGQHEQAVTLAQQLLGQAQASADPRPQWLALSYLSSCLYYLKRYDEAEYYTLQQLQIAQQANNSYASIEVRNTLGLIYVAKGQLNVAFDYYQQSIDMAEKLHALHHLRSVTANLAMLYIQQKRYDEGLALYLRSIEATQRTDDMYGLAMRYGALCQIYAELARWPEAKQTLSQWYAAAEADNNFKVHLHGLYALVDVLINADRHTDAAYWFGVLCANALPMHQDQAEQDQREGPIRAALGDAAADTHIQRGKDADFDTAMQVLRDVLNAL